MLLKKPIDNRDIAVLCSLALLSALIVWLRVNASILPYEDAAILLRYVLHLAQGHGFVWNVGEPPLDGATDFLLVVLTAGLVKAGLPLIEAMRGLGAVAHVLTVLLVYLMLRRYHGASRFIAGFSALFLALGPATGYIEACFGTPLFALLVATSYALLHECILRPRSRAWAWAFALSALLMGLVRPEGVVLALLMLGSLVYVKEWQAARQAIFIFVGVFLVLGGAFFLWRWNYFGHPLPLPYYVKGHGQLHFIGLKASIKHALLLGGAYVVPYLYGGMVAAYLAGRHYLPVFFGRMEKPAMEMPARAALFPLIPLTGFALVWVLVRSEMNFMGRFQYALLPMMLVSFPPLLAHLFDTFRRASDLAWLRDAALVVLVAVFLPVAGKGFEVFENHRDGRYDVAHVLADYADKGYTLATTEAGLLSLYSGWKVLDCWGLNDYRIAREGKLSAAYLAETAPAVVMIDAAFSPAVPLPETGDMFREMTLTMKTYAEENQYLLAASFGISPYNAHYYYVRPDIPDAEALVRRIRETEYYWYENSQRCIDYARYGQIESGL